MSAINEEIRIRIDQTHEPDELFGCLDTNLSIIREHFDVGLVLRQDEIILTGPDAERASGIIHELLRILGAGERLDPQKVRYVVGLFEKGVSYKDSALDKDVICFTHKGKPVRPKTVGQQGYAQAIRGHDISFGIGPAGTGKTYLAVAMAVSAFKNKEVAKIILARPAVEAGERLGFLPGDLQEKVDPYLRPLYDALDDMLPAEKLNFFITNRVIEVAPLAFMRGRTLDHAFIILDEAQNCTTTQLKMFLTRIGPSAKAIITGDLSQIDLPGHQKSGLRKALNILAPIDGIGQLYLSSEDVVRHRLVKEIIKSYDASDEQDEAEKLKLRETRDAMRESQRDENKPLSDLLNNNK